MKGDGGIRKRSVTLAGHRTSISLEDIFWQLLRQAAEEDGLSLAALIARIDRQRLEGEAEANADASSRPGVGLSSALRVYVVRRLCAQLDRVP
ncbi:ribbon-helix-helix domain-containing protein [Fodinicurvata halophila]|uniref:Ribbon-helix-helix domain-containing protein n=1 Tax=Fodinicurvata halophila TaxID=1419723 RepID=A0ABV8URP1_9PROT